MADHTDEKLITSLNAIFYSSLSAQSLMTRLFLPSAIHATNRFNNDVPLKTIKAKFSSVILPQMHLNGLYIKWFPSFRLTYWLCNACQLLYFQRAHTKQIANRLARTFKCGLALQIKLPSTPFTEKAFCLYRFYVAIRQKSYFWQLNILLTIHAYITVGTV